MSISERVISEYHRRRTHQGYRSFFERMHIDGPLLGLYLILIACGYVLLDSASLDYPSILSKQLVHWSLGLVAMLVVAQLPHQAFRRFSPALFIAGLILLVMVLLMGKIGKGAKRWIDIGFFRFQPSEIMKFAVPMMLAWWHSPHSFPAKPHVYLVSFVIILIPTLCIVKQPDLGTALLILMTGFAVLLASGFPWRYVFIMIVTALISIPFLWTKMHTYQQNRVLTLLNPERDPLGTGYHIIQSKIAIGSGSIFGKGWLQGSQSHLDFLPEHATDFIFALCGEEFGFVGCILVILIIAAMCFRILYLAILARDRFGQLLMTGLGITFFLYAFVNIGMVIGLLPVVGLPLPFISYGGTSVLTLSIALGIVMSLNSHRKH